VEFRVLGQLEVEVSGRVVALRPQERALLAILLIEAGRIVDSERLLELLYGAAILEGDEDDEDHRQFERAQITLRAHVAHLRRSLEPERAARAPSSITKVGGGYRLDLGPAVLDANVFRERYEEGLRASDNRDTRRAADLLREALALWRGPVVLADLRGHADLAGVVLRFAENLEEMRRRAREVCIEAELALGRHFEVLDELRMLVDEQELQMLVDEQPSNEATWRWLALALYRTGRYEEAVRACRDGIKGRRRHGFDSPVLQALQREILNRDWTLDWPGPPEAVALQLRPDTSAFTDREDVLAEVQRQLETATRDRSQVTSIVLSGKPGVGKTALAVHAAHRVRAWFPDRIMYVDLGGVTKPREPAAVLELLLRALGVEGAAIPGGEAERAELFRTRVAGRRVLLVLDNAAGGTQVRPLLPWSPTCAVMVTSRRRLTSIEASYDAELDVFEPDSSVELLAKLVKGPRVAENPEVARDVAALCGQLPLAVRIAGARLAAKPHWSVEQLRELLEDEHQRLDVFKSDDLDLRASFEVSHRDLGGQDQRAFRLLGLLDAPSFASWAVAALTDDTLPGAHRAVERLVDAQLLEVAQGGAAGSARYRFHDLLRLFAREQAADDPEGRPALGRVLRSYLWLAERARALLEPGGSRRPRVHAPRWAKASPDTVEAMLQEPVQWFRIERDGLLAAVQQARDSRLRKQAWQLAETLTPFFDLLALTDDWQRTHDLALEAAHRSRDRIGEAWILHGLGRLRRYQGRFDAAATTFEESLRLFEALEDRHGLASALRGLGDIRVGQARWDEAVADVQRSLAIFHELGDRAGEASALSGLGEAAALRGRWEEATDHIERSLEISRDLGDRRNEASTLRDLGVVYRERARFEDAAECFDRCLDIFSELGDRRSAASTLVSSGVAHQAMRNETEALRRYDEARRIFEELHDQRWQAAALYWIAQIRLRQGDRDHAVEHLRQAASMLRPVGDRRLLANTLVQLGQVLRDDGDEAGARTTWEEALPILRLIDPPEAARVEDWLK